MKLAAIIAVALVVGIAAGALATNQLRGTARDQRVAGDKVQTPDSRFWIRQQRRAARVARQVFPSGHVVEVERENVGRAEWEVELLARGRLYEVRLNRTFGVIGFDREPAGEATTQSDLGPISSR